jgi:hypothetical protein
LYGFWIATLCRRISIGSKCAPLIYDAQKSPFWNSFTEDELIHDLSVADDLRKLIFTAYGIFLFYWSLICLSGVANQEKTLNSVKNNIKKNTFSVKKEFQSTNMYDNHPVWKIIA